jgi:membrane fusion protein (multidrug efflux system)
MKKRMRIMLIGLAILFGGIFLFKAFQNYMVKRFLRANQDPIVTVSTMKVGNASWQPHLNASGSLRAIHGVSVTTQLAGMVQSIYFAPGGVVKKGTVLVQLNSATEIGTLHSLQAQAELAKITYNRDKAQYAAEAISKQQLDSDYQNLQNLNAQVIAQAATVAKKTIIAPFSGRLGVNNINLGQYLNPGDKVTTLQALDPIWADFYLPQQALSQLKLGLTTNVTSDTYPHQTFIGKITTIEPAVDPTTRNVLVEATISNPHYELSPGMFVSVEVKAGAPQTYLTVPQTAVAFNPYGDVVYVVEQQKERDADGKPILTAKQSFVITGETRGEQVTILKGINYGDTIVTSGQLKLKNGSKIAINNTVVPGDNPAPIAPNEY